VLFGRHLLFSCLRAAAMRTKSRPVVQQPPADFAEVKRRFIRQNRELAKNNSSQSLRIRSLELEVSRLLGDNLDLREKVLQLEHELYTAKTQVSSEAVRTVKDALRAKIAELSGLVDGLDHVAQHDGEVQRPACGRKSMEGQWRERQPLTEVMRESAMPTITEDKLYPRRTLGADEIQAIRLSDNSSNESPDLGPPPVAHFDYEDPVKPQPSPSAPNPDPVPADDDLLPGLSVNLETRRRRKDGQPRLEIRRRSILPQSPDKKDADGSTMLRTGAKRKLADRDVEKPLRPVIKDDFTFRRTTAEARSTRQEPSSTPDERPDEAPEDVRWKQAPRPAKATRKVLGDKSVNMSPRKVSVRTEKPGKLDLDQAIIPPRSNATDSAAREPSRSRRVSSIPLPSPPRNNVSEVADIALSTSSSAAAPTAQHTPAAPDFFSPTSSELSTGPIDVRAGTPPPGDLSTLSMTTDGGTRPSRRARAAVNYAEPSLVAKMRRPGKQMVDAISGLQDPRRAMSTSVERKSTSASKPATIKKEYVDDESWRSLPAAEAEAAASPLGQKSSDGGGRSDPIAPADSADNVLGGLTNHPSAASATISVLMAGSRKRRSPADQGHHAFGSDLEAATMKMEELDIYDFKESSSPDENASGRPVVARNSGSASHRRHSSIPKDLSEVGGSSVRSAMGGGGSLVGVVGRSERAANRRKSMML